MGPLHYGLLLFIVHHIRQTIHLLSQHSSRSSVPYLESIVISPEPLLITGDFNIHVDELGDQDGVAFLEILESMGFLQHVDKPTHRAGHTLDLIITRQCDPSVLASAPTTDYFL